MEELEKSKGMDSVSFPEKDVDKFFPQNLRRNGNSEQPSISEETSEKSLRTNVTRDNLEDEAESSPNELASCLICCRQFMSLAPDVVQLICDVPPDASCLQLEAQLQIVFVLRKLLLVPTDACERIILAHGSPSEWGISFCFECSELIDDAQRISAKIKDYMQQFTSVQETVKSKFIQTVKSCQEGKHSVAQSIRKEAKQLFGDDESEESAESDTDDDSKSDGSLTPRSTTNTKANTEKLDSSSEHNTETEAYPMLLDLDCIKNSPQSVNYDDDPLEFNESFCIYPGSVVKVKVQTDDEGDEDYVDEDEETASLNELDLQENEACSPGKQLKKTASKAKTRGRKPAAVSKTGEKRDRKPKGVACPSCKKRFPTNTGLNLHYRKVHVAVNSGKKTRNQTQSKAGRSKKSADEDSSANLNARNQERKYTVKCPECIQHFPSEYFRDAHHKRKHLGIEKPFQCEKCGKAFERHQSLVGHKKSCTGDGNFIYPADPKLQETQSFKCTQCPQKFTTDAFRIAHEKRRHEGIEKPYSCHVCQKTFSRNFSRMEHLKYVHQIIEPLNFMDDSNLQSGYGDDYENDEGAADDWLPLNSCDESNSSEVSLKKTVNSAQLKKFIRPRKAKISDNPQARKPRSFKCSYEGCDKAFGSELMLNGHRRGIHEGEERPYHCDQSGCDKTFKFYPSLQVHIQMNHTSETDGGTYICETCGKTFYKKIVFQRHVSSHKYKDSDKIYPCDECGKLFRSVGHVERHKVLHNQIPNCEVCDAKFLTKVDWFNHRRLEHQLYDSVRKDTEICGKCNKTFSSIARLKLHVENVHEKLFKYVCTVCNMGYPDKSSHDRHVLSHSGVKPYNCDICGKGMTRSADLKRHRRIHTGEKPYKCDQCNEYLADTSKLRKHMKTAHGEPAHECDVCFRKFYMYSQLRVHKQTHEPSHVEQLKYRKRSFANPGTRQVNNEPQRKKDKKPQKPKNPSGRKRGRPPKTTRQASSSDSSDCDYYEVPPPANLQQSQIQYQIGPAGYQNNPTPAHQPINLDLYRPNNPSLVDFQPHASSSGSAQAMNLLQHGYIESNRYLQHLHQHLNSQN